MLYYHETTEFEPDGKGGHWWDDYWKEFIGRLAPTMARLGVPVVGAWYTALGAGNTNEIIFLYRTQDYASYGEFIRRAHGPQTDPVVQKRRGEMWVYREHWYTKLMLPTPAHELSILKATENGARRPGGAKQDYLYYQELVWFEHDGKNGYWRSDYWKMFCDRLVPHLKKQGLDLVGAWETPVGSGQGNEFTLLWRTRDWASWAEFAKGRRSDPFVRQWRADTSAYLYRWETRLLTPAPGHEAGILREKGE